jgi:hypothetical protein
MCILIPEYARSTRYGAGGTRRTGAAGRAATPAWAAAPAAAGPRHRAARPAAAARPRPGVLHRGRARRGRGRDASRGAWAQGAAACRLCTPPPLAGTGPASQQQPRRICRLACYGPTTAGPSQHWLPPPGQEAPYAACTAAAGALPSHCQRCLSALSGIASSKRASCDRWAAGSPQPWVQPRSQLSSRRLPAASSAPAL